MENVQCPYCENWQEVCHDDGFGYSEDKAHEDQCLNCEKYFVFHTSISFRYSSGKADCLNGSDHDWKKMIIYPKFWPDARRCSDCEMEEKGKIVTQWEQDAYFAEIKYKNK